MKKEIIKCFLYQLKQTEINKREEKLGMGKDWEK